MKKLILVCAMAVGTMAFAKTGDVKTSNKIIKKVATSCTVTVKFGKSNVTITNSCTCSQTAACDGAYKIARLAAQLADNSVH